ncbi:MAG TPA: dihydroneopterin aldolase [Ignavibacteria bacterium]|nr:dihydroneopterin aldolase [Ignavibacteria bacterium]HMR40054.1 dihydroneopterin aldolase [Ignavibacteria bacterium]
MTRISINNAVFYAYHGVLDYEKKYGNKFELDIEMECDIDELGESDDLEKTVDYLSVYNLAKEILTCEKYNLLETVNLKICKGILENFPMVTEVRVRIRKPNAPLGIIDSVEIENKLKRS